MKYIDADLLRKEIEKRLKNIRDYMTGVGMKYKGPKYHKAQGKESAYDALLSIIDSHQQEQPEDLSSLIAEAQGVAKRLLESHSFYGALPEDIRYEHTTEKWHKILKAISSCSQQEQQEVDLEVCKANNWFEPEDSCEWEFAEANNWSFLRTRQK